MLTVGSLFSGIGGLDLGLERAGMEVIWQSEIDPFATKVLQKHWPKVVNHGNIKEINWKEIERPDVICGGYPCQPFSQAGKRRGEEDPRHLWPWVRDAIGELRPRYAILENVRGHLSMGGLTVVGELTNLGYCCEWRVVSAASVGANHRRDRVIIVAYPNDSRNRTPGSKIDEHGKTVEQGRQNEPQRRSSGHGSNVAYPNGERLEGSFRESHERRSYGLANGSSDMADSDSFGRLEGKAEVFSAERRQSALAGLTLGSWWTVEPNVGRLAHGVPGRVDRLRALGNAVVPQVAEVVGRLVMSHASST